MPIFYVRPGDDPTMFTFTRPDHCRTAKSRTRTPNKFPLSVPNYRRRYAAICSATDPFCQSCVIGMPSRYGHRHCRSSNTDVTRSPAKCYQAKLIERYLIGAHSRFRCESSIVAATSSSRCVCYSRIIICSQHLAKRTEKKLHPPHVLVIGSVIDSDRETAPARVSSWATASGTGSTGRVCASNRR